MCTHVMAGLWASGFEPEFFSFVCAEVCKSTVDTYSLNLISTVLSNAGPWSLSSLPVSAQRCADQSKRVQYKVHKRCLVERGFVIGALLPGSLSSLPLFAQRYADRFSIRANHSRVHLRHERPVTSAGVYYACAALCGSVWCIRTDMCCTNGCCFLCVAFCACTVCMAHCVCCIAHPCVLHQCLCRVCTLSGACLLVCIKA